METKVNVPEKVEALKQTMGFKGYLERYQVWLKILEVLKDSVSSFSLGFGRIELEKGLIRTE